MKKVLISLAVVILVVIVGGVAILAYIGFTSDASTEDIFGTWAVAFRFVDDEGNYKYVEKDESNKHGECKDEYVVFDKKTFKHYKQGKVNMQTAIKYTGSTMANKETQGTTGLSLKSLCSVSECFFELDKYSDIDDKLSVNFYSSNCMTFRYGQTILAILIKCENIGDEIDRTNEDSIVGKWSYFANQFDGDKQLSDYTSETTKNGLLVLYGEEWDETSGTTIIINNEKASNYQDIYIYLYAKRDYIIELKVTRYSFPSYRDEKKAVSGDLVRVYFRNDG